MIQPAVGSLLSEIASRRPFALESELKVEMIPTQRAWNESQRIRGSVSPRSAGTANRAHVGSCIRRAPAPVVTPTLPFVVVTTWDGLTPIHGSGGSHPHASAAVVAAKELTTTGSGWATSRGAGANA